MISFTEYCFCFWVVVFFFWKGGIWFFLELLKGGKEGRDLNNNNTNTNINTHTNTHTNTNTHRRIREKEEEKEKEKKNLRGIFCNLNASPSSYLLLASRTAS